jgi:hypothetical protein
MDAEDDWDFDAAAGYQSSTLHADVDIGDPWEEGPVTDFAVEKECSSPRLPLAGVSSERTPSPQPAKEGMSLSPTPKVRRKISKKRAPCPFDKPLTEGALSVASKGMVLRTWGQNGWPGLTDETFDAMPPRAKYFLFYNRLRQWLAKQDFALVPSERVPLLQKAAANWKPMAMSSKGLVVQEFVQVSHPPLVVEEFAKTQWPIPVDEEEALCARTVLFTWNGHWGIVEDVPKDLVTESHVVEWLRGKEDVKLIWDEFVEWLKHLGERLGCVSWGCSFEVASSTWEATRVLRVHAHCFMKKESKMRLQSSCHLMFRGCLPNKAGYINGQSVRCVGSWAGMYYVVAPKLFSLFTFSTKAPFSEFMVSPEWIFNLLQANKISYENAKRELIKCGKGLTRRLMDLEKWRSAKAEMELAARATAVQEQLRSSMKQFRDFPIVKQWLSDSTARLVSRKKFLVITGPSGVGKSEYVRSLFELGAVLELNCAGVKDVCLAAFNAQMHRCIFWDELSVAVVANNRKVFQHPACWVDLGHSPTGSHVSYHWLNDAVSIVASNRWHEDLQSLKSYSDRCWVEANCVVLVVDAPMWLPS